MIVHISLLRSVVLILICGFNTAYSSDLDVSKSLPPLSQEIAAVKERNALTDDRVMEVDQRGFHQTGNFSYQFSEESWFRIVDYDSALKRVGKDRFGDTQESELELLFEVGLADRDQWKTRLRSLSSRQAINRFTSEVPLERWEERTYSISQGWKSRLARGLSVEIFGGAAQCQSVHAASSEIMPIGGLQLVQNFSWGSIEANLEQEVRGGSSFTGIYGSQVERRFAVRGQVPFSTKAQLTWNCGLALAEGAFEKEQVLQTAGVVSAGVDLEYRWSRDLTSSVGYLHRKMLGNTDRAHGATGPTVFASLSYTLF